MGDRRFRRCVGLEVEFYGAEVRMLPGGPLCDGGDLGRIAALGLAHRGIDNVAGLGERAGGHQAEARGRASNEDGMFVHDGIPSRGGWFEGVEWPQIIPPLARSVWPLIQTPSGPARKAT